MPNPSALPSVERWWPHLDIPAKQWLVAHLDEPVPVRIVTEITTLCDVDVIDDDTIVLTPEDQHFISTQIEFVD